MKEFNKFKNNFNIGRLLWVVGSSGSGKTDAVMKALKRCQINPREVLHLNAQQFIDMIQRGMDQATIDQYPVILLKDFENLEAHLAAVLIKSIQVFDELKTGFTMRLILVSEERISDSLKQFSTLDPAKIILDQANDDPEDLNERLHGLISDANRVSRQSVKKLSPKMAAYLELFGSEFTNREILALLILGMQRSDGRTLRFRDVLPEYSEEGRMGGGAECPRNE